MATTIEVLLKNGGPPSAAGQTKPPEDDKEKDDEKPDPNIFKRMSKGIMGFVKGQLGLNFKVGAILKQSQIFTSTIGVVFQLLGALVDVMLAPLLPLLIPFIRMIGAAIPHIAKFMETHIAPRIQAIVDWVRDFLKNWDGSLDMLLGEKGFGGLLAKLGTWFTKTAAPFIGQALLDLGEFVGQKLVDLWDWFKDADRRIQGWIVTFFITQFHRIPKMLQVGWRLVSRLIIPLMSRFIRRLPGVLGSMSAALIEMMVPVFGDVGVAIGKAFWAVGRWVMDIIRPKLVAMVKPIVNLGKFVVDGIIKGITKLPGQIYRLFLKIVEQIMSKAGEILSKSKVFGSIGRTLGRMATLAKKAQDPKVMSRALKSVGIAAKATKAIPVLGAAATLGFGMHETYRAYKEHGREAAFAYAGKTLAATTLTAGGASAAGLLVDVGGSVALGQRYKNGNGDNTVNLTVNMNDQGVTTSSSIQQLKNKIEDQSDYQFEIDNPG